MKNIGLLFLASCLSACGPASQNPDGGDPDGNGQCPVMCVTTGDCCPGEECIGGVCRELDACPSGCNWECDRETGQVCNRVSGFCESGTPPLNCTGDCDCYAGETCRDGRCQDMCEADVECPEGEICTGGICQPAACQTREDCAGPTCLVCKNGQCQTPADVCVGDQECCVGYHCNFGSCIPDGEGCVADSDCPPETPVCMDGKCIPWYPECQVDADCAAPGQVCQDGRCVQPGCTADTCPVGQWCDLQTGLCKDGCDSNEDCTPPATCDYGTHRCIVTDCCGGQCDPVTQACDPLTCTCTDLCTGDGDCPAGTHCDLPGGICVPDVVQCDPAEFSSPIMCDDSVNGTFEPGCEATQRPGSLAKQFVFSGTAGTRITADLSSAADAFMYLIGPGDVLLASNDDGGSGSDSRIVWLLEADGDYIIEATTFTPAVTGAFVLTLACSDDTDCTGPIACDNQATGSWTPDCPSAHRSGAYARMYTFSGTGGDRVIIDLSSAVDAYLYLLDPAGSVLAYNDDAGMDTDAQIQQTLPADGEYTIEATTLMPMETGSFELGLQCIQESDCIAPIECGQVLEGSWTGQCRSYNRYGSYARLFTFEGVVDQHITVILTSQTVDTYLYLLSPDGEIAASDDDGGVGSNSRIAGTVLMGGTWAIEATTFGMGETGDFEVELRCN